MLSMFVPSGADCHFIRSRSHSTCRLFPPQERESTAIRRTSSLRRKEEKEPVYDQVYEKFVKQKMTSDEKQQIPSVDVRIIDATPINADKKIIRPRQLSFDETPVRHGRPPLRRSFGSSCLRNKVSQAPRRRRVSFNAVPEIIGEIKKEKTEERVKNMQIARNRLGLAEPKKDTCSSESKKEKELKRNRKTISQIFKALLPWKMPDEQKKSRQHLEEEAEKEEQHKLAQLRSQIPADWTEKNAAVVKEFKDIVSPTIQVD